MSEPIAFTTPGMIAIMEQMENDWPGGFKARKVANKRYTRPLYTTEPEEEELSVRLGKIVKEAKEEGYFIMVYPPDELAHDDELATLLQEDVDKHNEYSANGERSNDRCPHCGTVYGMAFGTGDCGCSVDRE